MKRFPFVLTTLFLAAGCAVAAGGNSPGAQTSQLSLAGVYASGEKTGTEIVSVQQKTLRAVLSNSESGAVDLLDIHSPAQPVKIARFDLGLKSGEQLTSVAFHPAADYFLAAIQGAGPRSPGRVEIRSAANGQILKSLPTGVGPDSVVVDFTGRLAATANEAEEFTYDPSTKTFDSVEGSLTVIHLEGGPEKAAATQIALSEPTDTGGMTAEGDGRFLERPVDWNGNGQIDKGALDVDGNGQIETQKVKAGTFLGKDVFIKSEAEGETFLIPLGKTSAKILEPECVAFSPDGNKLYATLQENNAIAIANTAQGIIRGYFGLGTSRHMADVEDDGSVGGFTQRLMALREPDGLAVSPDGNFIVTADEGDTAPKTSKRAFGKPAGGGRTVSVFAPPLGVMMGDTANGLDEAAGSSRLYPENRSEQRGSEPEMLILFTMGSTLYAGVSLERADGVALISLEDTTAPKVIEAAGIDPKAPRGSIGPEGIDHFEVDGRHYLITANEKNGTAAVFEVKASQAPSVAAR